MAIKGQRTQLFIVVARQGDDFNDGVLFEKRANERLCRVVYFVLVHGAHAHFEIDQFEFPAESRDDILDVFRLVHFDERSGHRNDEIAEVAVGFVVAMLERPAELLEMGGMLEAMTILGHGCQYLPVAVENRSSIGEE